MYTAKKTSIEKRGLDVVGWWEGLSKSDLISAGQIGGELLEVRWGVEFGWGP